MTKEELRTQYINQGWEVQPVANWLLVSSIEGKVKYDLNVVSPTNQFSTAQVVVTDDGGANEDATPFGAIKTPETSFRDEVRAFLDTKEGAQVFAIAITQIYEKDGVAEAKAYMTDNTERNYVIKKRNDVISFQQTV